MIKLRVSNPIKSSGFFGLGDEVATDEGDELFLGNVTILISISIVEGSLEVGETGEFWVGDSNFGVESAGFFSGELVVTVGVIGGPDGVDGIEYFGHIRYLF